MHNGAVTYYWIKVTHAKRTEKMQKMFSLLKDLLGQGGEHTFTICLFSTGVLHASKVRKHPDQTGRIRYC